MSTPIERVSLGFMLCTLILSAFATTAAAQGVNEVALDVAKPPGGLLEPAGTTELSANVTAGCGLVLTSTDATATLALGDAPEWLTSDGASVTFAAGDCAGGASTATKPVSFPVTADASAPGFQSVEFKVTVTLGSATDEVTVKDVEVDYLPGYSLDPSGDQTFEVNGDTYSFNLTITIGANAKTMTMFEDLSVSAGSIDGLNAMTYDVAAGQTEDKRLITFKAPSFAWTQSNVTFYTYAHCIDGSDCPPTGEQNITWTFVNMAPAPETQDDDETTEESPAVPIVPLVLLGALLVAFTRRR